MSTLEDLKALADRKRALIEQLREAFRLRIESEERELAALEAAAATLSTRETLTEPLTPVKVNVNKVTDEHRHNIAKGQKPDDKAFMRTLVERGYTQGKLAKALNITPALLSMYRTGKRPIPQERAARVEELTGWKATRRNWPGNIVS